jgi:phospholipase/carboxylesterase
MEDPDTRAASAALPRDDSIERCTRRDAVRWIVAGTALSLGCRSDVADPESGDARLLSRPVSPVLTTRAGAWKLGLGTDRDGYLLVPQSYNPDRPLPLVLGLHGAGRNGLEAMQLLEPYAESAGFLVLAVDSRRATWDAMYGAYGPDVEFIDHALEHCYVRCAVDPARIFVQGFSDGASYALGLGLANGDLFPKIIAFSAGFIPEASSPRRGKPLIYESHGKTDRTLRIDTTSRVIVPHLRDLGYCVSYVEFDGGHTVPAEIATAAIDWMMGPAVEC